MKIKEVSIENFMCHKETIIKPHDKLNFIVGPNGAGKTSFLNAIQLVLFKRTSEYGYTVNNFNQISRDRKGIFKIVLKTDKEVFFINFENKIEECKSFTNSAASYYLAIFYPNFLFMQSPFKQACMLNEFFDTTYSIDPDLISAITMVPLEKKERYTTAELLKIINDIERIDKKHKLSSFTDKDISNLSVAEEIINGFITGESPENTRNDAIEAQKTIKEIMKLINYEIFKIPSELKRASDALKKLILDNENISSGMNRKGNIFGYLKFNWNPKYGIMINDTRYKLLSEGEKLRAQIEINNILNRGLRNPFQFIFIDNVDKMDYNGLRMINIMMKEEDLQFFILQAARKKFEDYPKLSKGRTFFFYKSKDDFTKIKEK